MRLSSLVRAVLAALLVACGSSPRVIPMSYDEDGREPNEREQSYVSAIAARVETLRGLRFRRPIRVGVISEEAIMEGARERTERARARLAEEGVTPAPRRGRRLSLGLVSTAMTRTDTGWFRSVVRSHYNHRCVCIRLVEGPLARAIAEENIGAAAHIAHELDHDLVAQHFEYPPPGWAPRSQDGHRARRMVSEGDAELIAALYLAEARGVRPANMVQRVLEHNQRRLGDRTAFRGESAYIRQQERADYVFGLAFVFAVWQGGGWEAVNELHRTPPESTEQILHPALYTAGHPPVHVDAPRSQTLLDAGYTRLGEWTFGELETAVWFGRLTDDFDFRVAAGWGGDNSTVYELADGSTASLWLSKWDTEADAEEAERAARRIISRSESSAIHLVTRSGSQLLVIQDVPPELHARVLEDVL